MRARALVLIAVLHLLGLCGYAQKPVSFPAEYIDFKIDSIYFTVNGMYTFSNNTHEPINNQIIFPFAVNANLVDSIRIWNLNYGCPVNFTKQGQTISFNLYIAPSDTVDVNIFYRQPVAKRNTYILTTTKSWGAPLQKAEYSITLSKNIKLEWLWCEPDSATSDSMNVVYFWHKQNFWPLKDFEVILNK